MCNRACQVCACLGGSGNYVNVPDDAEIRFPDGLTLRAATEEDANRWHDSPRQRPDLPSAAFVTKLTIDREQSKPPRSDGLEPVRTSLAKARRAMAVLKMGRVGGGKIFVCGTSPFRPGVMTRGPIDVQLIRLISSGPAFS